MLDLAREGASKDRHCPQLRAYSTLIAPTDCFCTRSFCHSSFIAASWFLCVMSPVTGGLGFKSLDDGLDGVRGLFTSNCDMSIDFLALWGLQAQKESVSIPGKRTFSQPVFIEGKHLRPAAASSYSNA